MEASKGRGTNATKEAGSSERRELLGRSLKRELPGDFLVVQWLRLGVPSAGARV